MKKFLFLAALFCVLLLQAGEKLPKYIILFIGDGMATPQRMIAEEFALKSGYGKLLINHFPFHATTRTVSTSSLVTDSAAAGTAIACGTKTANGRIGVDPKGKKLESVAELAKKKSYKVGIVSTMVINHATPASFYGHRPSRQQYYELGLDLIESGFDLFAGGGIRQVSKNFKGPKPDIYGLARKKGYRTITDKKEFLALKPGCGKFIYSAAPGYMPAAMDTPPTGTTLAEMTAKALELLKNPKGFFLMVEGGTIDVFGHANEAAANLREVLALDQAVKAAVDFMKKHPEDTLIVVTGDHETGGMTMGFAGSGYSMSTERLAFQKVSAGAFAKIVKNAQTENKNFSFADAQKLLTRDFGFKFSGDPKKDPMVLSAAQIKLLEDGFIKKKLAHAAKNVMSQKAGIGWTTGSHTALPVLTTSIGVQAQRFTGFIDNTDISKKLKELLR
ncbi:MAG: alkaline phosphatase [Lentisphaeria bacterium]|nr:alkaline phosphatase [Lentisphaeria bacterium]